MEFFDRKDEVELLRQIREESRASARFTMMKGRRRIGKTTLLQQAYGDEDFLYFFVARKNEADLCADFQLEAERFFGFPLPGRILAFEQLFKYLLGVSRQRHMTLVIDEFQEFLRVNPSIFSAMQRDWDLGKRSARINLVVSGSINRMMELIFSADQPLYGRITHEIELRPFSTSVVSAILRRHAPQATADDLLALWAFTGGVAKYIELLVDGAAFTREAMIERILSEGSTFLNEGKALLVDEFGRDYACYFSILSLIAGGRTSRAEMQAALGGEDIGGYLTKLRSDYRLINRHAPFATEAGGRNVVYRLDDEFLRFWFRFVYKYQALIELKAYARLREFVQRDFEVFSGRSLERYFQQRLAETGRFTSIGGWWDRKGENEIDLIGVDDVNRRILFAEVKRSASRIDLNVLRRKADVFLRTAGRYGKYARAYRGLSLEDMVGRLEV